MNKLITFLLLIACFECMAQAGDTVVVAQGRVVNAQTKQPIVARIVYESLPYGSRVGVVKNSEYSFPMFDQERYSITVEAPGFLIAKYLLDPAEATDMKLVKDIELSTGVPEEKKKPDAGVVITLNNVIFQQAQATLEPESYKQLDYVVEMMNENPKMVIQLEGHTDFLGNANRNLKLSEERVAAVRDYLVSQGLDRKRIKLKAFGGSMPLSREDTPEAHRLNRRVELRILKN